MLDPGVVEWFEANPYMATPLEELTPEILELTRSPAGAPPTREVARVGGEAVQDARNLIEPHREVQPLVAGHARTVARLT